jgi:hypothetical protein
MNVIVGYDTGATMSYSLNAFNAWEGYHVAFNGTKGRLEHTIVEQLAAAFGSEDDVGAAGDREITRVIPMRGAPKSYEIWRGEGGHGGGDKVMLDDIFLPSPPADKYLRASDERAGAASVLVGIAANECFRTGQPVKVASLVTGWTRPDFAPMPTNKDPIPMPVAPARPPRAGG